MKNRPLLLTGLIALIAGVILIISHSAIGAEGIVVALGIMFVVVGLINMLTASKDKESKGFANFLTMTAYIAALTFGVSLLIFRETFMGLISWAFGISLGGCVLWQLGILLGPGRKVGAPAWFYAFPGLLLIGTVFVLLQDTSATGAGDPAVMLGTGISLIVLGLANMIEQFTIGSSLKAMEKERQQREADGKNSQVIVRDKGKDHRNSDSAKGRDKDSSEDADYEIID